MKNLRIYNTLTRQVEEFKPINPDEVTMYVCGPTVYDHAHLGHARCYIIWDVITRYLRFKGYNLKYVRNITDVDDKIIKRAKEQNTSPGAIASKFITEFETDMKAISVKKPDLEPKATEYIQEMINFTEALIDKGYAYESQGNVFFRVNKYEKYGELSNKKLDDLRSGARVKTDENKENPMDFALWKSVQATDEIVWDSPWGKGRPGWHTECCAMINKLMGPTIDIHAGGNDLMFPHHENERAQMEALTGKTFVNCWMHNGFVNVDSEKMSKSLGNFRTIKELSKTYDSNTIRLFILTNHYRMPVDFNDEALLSAKKGIKRIANALKNAQPVLIENNVDQEKSNELADQILQKINHFTSDDLNTSFAEIAEKFGCDTLCITSPWAKSEFSSLLWRVNEFGVSMDLDFNTSKALAILFDVASMVKKNKNAFLAGKNKNKDVLKLLSLQSSILEKLSKVLGFYFQSLEELEDLSSDLADDLMDVIIKIRKQAKEEKNWPLADIIRNSLKEKNIIIKDHKDGNTTWQLEK